MQIESVNFIFDIPNIFFTYDPFNKKFYLIDRDVQLFFNVSIVVMTNSRCCLNYGRINFEFKSLNEYEEIIETLRKIGTDNKQAIIYMNDEKNEKIKGIATTLIKDFPNDKKNFFFLKRSNKENYTSFENLLLEAERINW